MNYSVAEISGALGCLREFKHGYEDKNGVVRIGDVQELLDKIDVIEFCINKQRCLPPKSERIFKLFGSSKLIRFCRTCGAMVNKSQGYFCSNCGQRFDE